MHLHTQNVRSVSVADAEHAKRQCPSICITWKTSKRATILEGPDTRGKEFRRRCRGNVFCIPFDPLNLASRNLTTWPKVFPRAWAQKPAPFLVAVPRKRALDIPAPFVAWVVGENSLSFPWSLSHGFSRVPFAAHPSIHHPSALPSRTQLPKKLRLLDHPGYSCSKNRASLAWLSNFLHFPVVELVPPKGSWDLQGNLHRALSRNLFQFHSFTPLETSETVHGARSIRCNCAGQNELLVFNYCARDVRLFEGSFYWARDLANILVSIGFESRILLSLMELQCGNT